MANIGEGLFPVGMVKKAQDQKRDRALDFVSKYANNVSVSISNWDMTLVFGRVKGDNHVEESVEIVLSKEMAKVLAVLLGAHLQNFERKFGEIKIVDLTQLDVDSLTGEKPSPKKRTASKKS